MIFYHSNICAVRYCAWRESQECCQ